MAFVATIPAGGFTWQQVDHRGESVLLLVDANPGAGDRLVQIESQAVFADFASVSGPDDALEFANRHGRLGIDLVYSDRPQRIGELWSDWREAVERIRRTLTLRAALDGESIDLTAIHSTLRAHGESAGKLITAARAAIEKDVGNVLRQHVHIAFIYRSERAAVVHRSETLLGEIALQLAEAIVDSKTIVLCDGCGLHFVQRDPRQRYHSSTCRAAAHRRRQGGT